jgi:hypothetical protein
MSAGQNEGFDYLQLIISKLDLVLSVYGEEGMQTLQNRIFYEISSPTGFLQNSLFNVYKSDYVAEHSAKYLSILSQNNGALNPVQREEILNSWISSTVSAPSFLGVLFTSNSNPASSYFPLNLLMFYHIQAQLCDGTLSGGQNHQSKTMLIGDGGVGKTTIVLTEKIRCGDSPRESRMTIGVDCATESFFPDVFSEGELDIRREGRISINAFLDLPKIADMAVGMYELGNEEENMRPFYCMRPEVLSSILKQVHKYFY